MKRRIIIMLFVIVLLPSLLFSQASFDTLYIASWNVENLFDNIDDPNKNDEEYTESGRKEWNNKRIDRKIKNRAEVIDSMNQGKGPSILGITEVEHQHLLDTLISRHFQNRNYQIAYAESPDKRGIDNCLIYDADHFFLENIDTLVVSLASGYPTRYIFKADLKHRNGTNLHVFVNHWPSRRGGEEKSRPNREKAASVLKTRLNNLFNSCETSSIIVMGDFNDEPNNVSVLNVLEAKTFNCDLEIDPQSLFNLSSTLFEEGFGTYLYRGDWNMLDQIIISSDLIKSIKFKYLCDSFELFTPNFLLTKNGQYKGAATPTFGGSKYLGGYSDHIPIGAKFIVKKGNEE